MNELTPEKWQELADKLQAELADAESREKNANSRAAKLIVVALLLFGVAVALQFLIPDPVLAKLVAMAPLLGFLVMVMFVLRYRKLVGFARSDMDRIRNDIRQWKKKKPA
ncbi:MAG: hypothetical protein ICCCNLDF_01208 [Planctomycetes bacterium]|nr:hypothetical protein [Planctomycetota bacterium]